jgi:DNA-binding beta-propeller fold protein YncE
MIVKCFWVMCALLAITLTVVWPLAAWGMQPSLHPATEASVVSSASPQTLWLRTLIWSLGIGCGAVILGWGPGRLLAARLRAGRGALLMVALLWPLLVPSYVLFYALWQAWPVDSAAHEWLVRVGGLAVARDVTLAVALLLWSWPLAALCMAPVASTWSQLRTEQLVLDAAGRLRILGHHLRHNAPGLITGGVFVSMLVFANTTCFDLAGVFTISNELRAVVSMGGGPAMVPLVWPSVLLAVLGSITVLLCLRVTPELDRQHPLRTRSSAWVGAIVLWCLTLPIPVAALWLHAGPLAISTYVELYGGAMEHAIGRALLVGVLSIVPLVLLVRLQLDSSPWVRGVAWIAAVGWLAAGLLPATVLGIATEAAWNRPGTDMLMHGSGGALLLALCTRSALVPVALAWWLVRAEPQSLRESRSIDAGHGLASVWGTMLPRLVPAACTCIVLTAGLALGDIVLTGVLSPPAGRMPLAATLLNAMHYQRPEVVVLSLMVLLGWGVLAAACFAGGMALVRRALSRVAPLLVLFLLVGCGDAPPVDVDDADGRVPVESVLGHPGRGVGGFFIPRAIAVDHRNGTVYVIDKTGRVQVFDETGRCTGGWMMPVITNGKPTGIHVDETGLVWVADTHEFQVLAFDSNGTERRRFGTFGEQPGEFLYPTDVAIGPDDSIWVSEFGGNDRVQVFNADGTVRRIIGSVGSEPGQFSRPQAIALSDDGQRLYVADSCNHRIQVFDAEGTLVSVLGGPGREPGQLHYPYDLALLEDGSLLVSEYGSSRIQHLSPEGDSLGIWGTHGAGHGALNAPWGIDSDGEQVWILDTGNHRVVTMHLPE